MRNDSAYLETIRIAAEQISEFVSRMTLNEFLTDIRTRYAVERQLITLGEAANRVSVALKEQLPRIPWARLVQIRNFYVHGYDHLTPEQVWATAKRLVPRVGGMVAVLIPKEDEEETE